MPSIPTNVSITKCRYIAINIKKNQYFNNYRYLLHIISLVLNNGEQQLVIILGK